VLLSTHVAVVHHSAFEQLVPPIAELLPVLPQLVHFFHWQWLEVGEDGQVSPISKASSHHQRAWIQNQTENASYSLCSCSSEVWTRERDFVSCSPASWQEA
jgi:hypothetical protein